MTSPQTVSDDGTTWNLHRAGVDPIQFALADIDGNEADISADTVTFKVDGGPTVTLVSDPENPTGLQLIFDEAALAAIPSRGAEFRLKNETTGQLYLDGKVFVRGIA